MAMLKPLVKAEMRGPTPFTRSGVYAASDINYFAQGMLQAEFYRGSVVGDVVRIGSVFGYNVAQGVRYGDFCKNWNQGVNSGQVWSKSGFLYHSSVRWGGAVMLGSTDM